MVDVHMTLRLRQDGDRVKTSIPCCEHDGTHRNEWRFPVDSRTNQDVASVPGVQAAKVVSSYAWVTRWSSTNVAPLDWMLIVTCSSKSPFQPRRRMAALRAAPGRGVGMITARSRNTTTNTPTSSTSACVPE